MDTDKTQGIIKNAFLLKYIALALLIVSLSLGLFFGIYLIQSALFFLGLMAFVGAACAGILGWVVMNILSDTVFSLSSVVETSMQIRELLLDVRDGTKNFYKEKRRSRRLSHAININYGGAESGELKLAKTKNIGEFGCFIKTPEAFSRGDIMRLEIFLPTFPKPIPAKAKVAFVADQKFHPDLYPGIGLQYTEIKKEDQLKIREYIYTHLSRK